MFQQNPTSRKQLESKCIWHLWGAASRLQPVIAGAVTKSELVISGMFIFHGDVEHTKDGINLTTCHIHMPLNEMMALSELLGLLEILQVRNKKKKQRGYMQLKEVCTAVLVNTPMSSTCRISFLSKWKALPSNNAITVMHCLAQESMLSHAIGYILKGLATRGNRVTGWCWVSMTLADAWKCQHVAVISCEKNKGQFCMSKEHVVNVTACFL